MLENLAWYAGQQGIRKVSDAPDPDIHAWLPPLVPMSAHGNDWEVYLAALYEHFARDFIRSKPAYVGKRFAMKRYPMSANKEATFWHITSTGKSEADRLPDFRRCERICWPRPIIEAISSETVRVWRNNRGTDRRIVLALGDFSYVVVLDEHEDYVLLWTAYFVERDHQREKLRKDYLSWMSRERSNEN